MMDWIGSRKICLQPHPIPRNERSGSTKHVQKRFTEEYSSSKRVVQPPDLLNRTVACHQTKKV